ncbi:MAG: UvrD-helicase domain-containing protein, partial [Selenomonadaceae bacterium]|nr:UvrD-helicase domain-containing protein [Selenomonadaceae bacterium]
EQFFFDTDKIFNKLNPEQAKAVSCLNGPLLIMAGAGSGKTRVLTCRIANLIAQGISPWNILAITFTNKAADEMRTRAENLIGTPARQIVLRTFHSFCARLLRREIEITGAFTKNFAIYDASDSKFLVKQCVADLKLEEDLFANVHFKISDFKNNLVSVDERKSAARFENSHAINVAKIYELYQKRLQENNALDFDDLIFTTVKIFRKFPDVLERYQERFQYISVDEYQDTNVAQYVLTKMLAAKYKNLCVVGDADQSIYGWRGADMRNILNFEQDYPEATVIKLEQNYRSTKIILRAANAVIENNFNRKPKTLWTQIEGGEKIKLVKCDSDKGEAATVAREIKRLVTHENLRYNEIALLYRTNAQSRLFEEMFANLNIPYIIIGGLKFYDRKEIKDIVAYLHVINNPRDSVHLMRIINTPRRGIGPTNLNRLSNFADSVGSSIFEVVANKKLLAQVPGLSPKFRESIQQFAAMMLSFMESAKSLPLDKLISVVLEESGYLKMLHDNLEDGKLENVSREENLDSFINSATTFAEMNPGGTLEDFLNHIALITDLDNMDEEDSRVKLMTVHSAKGLEFPVVFVVGMEEGLFPHVNSSLREEDLEEERRACYVALTRAEKKLYITFAESRMFSGKFYNQSLSSFVKEIPDACLEKFGFNDKPAQKKFSSQQTYKPPQTIYRPPTAHRAAQMSKPLEKKNLPPV